MESCFPRGRWHVADDKRCFRPIFFQDRNFCFTIQRDSGAQSRFVAAQLKAVITFHINLFSLDKSYIYSTFRVVGKLYISNTCLTVQWSVVVIQFATQECAEETSLEYTHRSESDGWSCFYLSSLRLASRFLVALAV